VIRTRFHIRILEKKRIYQYADAKYAGGQVYAAVNYMKHLNDMKLYQIPWWYFARAMGHKLIPYSFS